MSGGPFLLVVGVAIFGMAQLVAHATASQGKHDWEIPEAKAVATESLREFEIASGQQRTRAAPERQQFVEIHAFAYSAQGTVGPLGLADIGLRVTPAGLSDKASNEYVLLAVGTWSKGCTYLASDGVPKGREVIVKLASGDQFKLSRGGDANLQFQASSKKLALCLAFAVPKETSGHMVLRVGKMELPVRSASQEAVPVLGGRSIDVGSPRSTGMKTYAATVGVWWVIAAIAALTLFLAFVAQKRLLMAWATARQQLVATGDIAAEYSIPELAEADVRSHFSTHEEPEGPGREQLSHALRAMQVDDMETAVDCIRQSLELGLSVKQQGRARLLLAEVALRRGDLIEAIREYRQCVLGESVALSAAFPAATKLAMIYSALGMRRSAFMARRIVASAPVMDKTPLASNTRRIGQLVASLKRSHRMRRARAWWRAGMALLRGIVFSTASANLERVEGDAHR